MQYDDQGRLLFSPSDLVVFWDGEFPAWMDRWHVERRRGVLEVATEQGLPLGVVLEGLVCQPDEADEESLLIASMGNEHELLFFKLLCDEGHDVVHIGGGDLAAGQTLEAMRRGATFVYQGRLHHDDFAGFADFLARTAGESSLGDHYYEPWDTKLAKSARPKFIVQLCAYAELLAAIQGRLPSRFTVVLGTGERKEFETKRFWYYYRQLKKAFLDFHFGFDAAGFRHPAISTSYGRWSSFAQDYLFAIDHLSQVANITHGQIKKLEAAGIGTLKQLAASEGRVPGLNAAVLHRLRLQASLQLQSWGKVRPLVQVRPPDPDEPRRGLALLPPRSTNDVFFDMEGYPLVDGGLEYLFGAICVDGEQPYFLDWWAHDGHQERMAFCAFIDWAYRRWQADHTMHIYHYAAYEVAAVRRLMGKHAVCETQVDELLRNQVFVDLYTVVRQGLVIGTAGYSLKDIECLYMDLREGDVTTAGGSVVAYHNWLTSGEGQDWRQSPLLEGIRKYNELDCISTSKLAKWLWNQQQSSGIAFIPPRPPAEKPESDDAASRHRSNELAQVLLRHVEDGQLADPERAKLQQLLAWLLEYHWREAKPAFWWMFERHAMTEQELYEDFACLAGLRRTATPPCKVKRSNVYEFRFDPEQETKLHEGATCYFAHDLSVTTTIESFDPEQGRIALKLGPSKPAPPDRLSVIPNENVSAKVIADAIYRYVDAWRNGVVLSQAVDDLLHRRNPRIAGHGGGAIVQPGDDSSTAAIDIVRRMQNTVLCVQGPPGAGKTYTAAQAILGLVKTGKRVGVTATSHKAILNVLRAVHDARLQEGIAFPIVKVGSHEDDPLVAAGVIEQEQPQDAAARLDESPIVVGGTAWYFAREDVQGRFDHVFVDEAGQFSLANAVGVGLATENLVLVGDQMQLAQPTQASHPGESGKSALNYLLDGKATIPPDLGIFLEQTWRMHPDVCRFVSEAFYDGRLKSHPRTAHQRIDIKTDMVQKGAGIVFCPVEHFGNAQASEEEAALIQRIVGDLLGGPVWDGEAGPARPITWDDILIIAPFNMQVRQLKQRLGQQARVGSVDKFQGQEAHVVVVSMCSSTLEDSPRGAEFLLEPNRLNVAVSRAKSLAIVVASPDLVTARCKTIKEMELVNLFCWLVDYSTPGLAAV